MEKVLENGLEQKQNQIRLAWVDYLKAFTCLLVALGHLLMSFQAAKIGNNALIEFLIYFIYLFHMPLFMMISGFLYGKTKKEFSWENYKKFEKKKIINLLVPYFTFYLTFLGINVMFSKSVNTPKGMDELIGIINNPMAPYWFLYALLAIFICVPLLEKLLKDNTKKVFFVFVLLKIVSIFAKTPLYFINSIMSWGIYFYLGTLVYGRDMKHYKSQVYVVLYVGIALLVYKFQDNIDKTIMEFIRILLAIFGIFIFTDIFQGMEKNKFLDTFKKYTFQIYLLHTIFAAGFRIVLLKLGITNYIVHFIVGMFASIYVPVLIAKISEKIGYTEFFFYPVKTVEKFKGETLRIENVRRQIGENDKL